MAKIGSRIYDKVVKWQESGITENIDKSCYLDGDMCNDLFSLKLILPSSVDLAPPS